MDHLPFSHRGEYYVKNSYRRHTNEGYITCESDKKTNWRWICKSCDLHGDCEYTEPKLSLQSALNDALKKSK